MIDCKVIEKFLVKLNAVMNLWSHFLIKNGKIKVNRYKKSEFLLMLIILNVKKILYHYVRMPDELC